MTRSTDARPDPSAQPQQQPGGEEGLVELVAEAIFETDPDAPELDDNCLDPEGVRDSYRAQARAAIATMRAHDPEPAIARWDDGSDLLLLGYAGGAHSDGSLAYLDTVLVQADGTERHMRFIRADRVGMQPTDNDRFEPVPPAGATP